MDKASYVYILANDRYGTLYIGVTANLQRRVWLHRENVLEGFSKKYHIHKLVWYEVHSDIVNAITREKHLKKWKRAWKVDLISEFNPTWRDLFDEIGLC